MLFHIEAKDKSQFIYHMNSLLVELQEQLQDKEEDAKSEEQEMQVEEQKNNNQVNQQNNNSSEPFAQSGKLF